MIAEKRFWGFFRQSGSFLAAGLLALVMLQSSCSEWFMDEPIYYSVVSLEDAFSAYNETITVSSADEYEKMCIVTEYYFCPGVSGPLMRIKITKDVCEEPPIVLSMSECEEYLECDPHVYIIGEKNCTTESGGPGVYITYCVKGFIQDGKCKGIESPGESLQDLSHETHTDSESDVTEFLEDACVNEAIEIYEDEAGPEDFSEDKCSQDKVDILLIVDLSASMSSEIKAVQQSIDSFSSENSAMNHLRWAMIVGPKNNSPNPGNKNYLYLASDLVEIDEFKAVIYEELKGNAMGQYEMLYDALYLSLKNLSAYQPYENDELLWPTWVGNVIDISYPPLDEFFVSWRPLSKKVIIIFTDEPGQSFLFPKSMIGKSYNTKDTITQKKIIKMLSTIEGLQVYAFTDLGSKSGTSGWLPIISQSPGKWSPLTDSVDDMTDHLSSVAFDSLCN